MEGALQPVTIALAQKPIRITDIVDVRTRSYQTFEFIERGESREYLRIVANVLLWRRKFHI